MLNFYKNKKVLITGHTGFKGAWICSMLLQAGANVIGYALEPPAGPNLYNLLLLKNHMRSIIGDIRDLDMLLQVFSEEKPEIVIHLAAQPIVRESYKNPVYTYDVNVMGTVNLLECVRLTDSVKSVVNVTTDKVYKNREWEWGYRENEELNGYDPYSNSKSCSELVTDSYKNSFFQNRILSVSTMRAGNVIGGGDFAEDRIIPDCVRAAIKGDSITIRNPYATRPFQHVLEPAMAYLMVAEKQYKNPDIAGCYNIGPDEKDCVTTGELANLFCKIWHSITGDEINWIDRFDGGPHEAGFLKLDSSKIKKNLGWKPLWAVDDAVRKAVELYLDYYSGRDLAKSIKSQINEYINGLDSLYCLCRWDISDK